jgi:DNA-damage-inducible protein D
MPPSSNELGVFHFEEDRENFEDVGIENGQKAWSARALMKWLGYESWQPFFNAINRAIGTCTTLGIPVVENFVQIANSEGDDFKLSRFACCLVALNGDVKKPRVAAAQAYFVSLAEVVRRYLRNAESVDRVMIREELSDREITLSGVAKQAGVEVYEFFKNAGYRGMYNMNYARLKEQKGLRDPKRSLLDFMGKDELAHNLFRLSLTEGRIKKEGSRGQWQLEQVAEDVGRRVRRTVIEETGVHPENLPIAEDIKKVRSGIKKAHTEMKKIDGKNRKK